MQDEIADSKVVVWRCRDRIIATGQRSLIMGILNVTPDSFSDGGRYLNWDQAVQHGLEMARDGADILDIGGESTRPGAAEVTLEEELQRVVPVIRALREKTDCLLSVDTTKAEVARQALEAGAHLINDISALTHDPRMAGVALAAGAGVVLMHMQGRPRTMQLNPQYDDLVGEIGGYLRQRLEELARMGLPPECVALDPGIGFGKSLEHNLELLARLPELRAGGRPLLVGASRKSFLGRLTGRETGDRLAASLGAAAYALLRGADILRVHDVKESCDLARVVDILREKERRHGVLVENSSAGALRIS